MVGMTSVGSGGVPKRDAVRAFDRAVRRERESIATHDRAGNCAYEHSAGGKSIFRGHLVLASFDRMTPPTQEKTPLMPARVGSPA